MLRSLVVVASIAVLAAACGGKSPAPQAATAEAKAAPAPVEPAASIAPAGDFGDVAIAKMQEYKGQVCGCADKACVEEAQKALMDWAMKNMDALKEFKPTPAQEAEADRIEGELDACEDRFAGEDGAPPTAPARVEPFLSAKEIISAMRRFKDQGCACKDAACLEEIENDMIEWAMAHMEDMKAIKPTKAEEAEADEIQDAMEACKARFSGKP